MSLINSMFRLFTWFHGHKVQLSKPRVLRSCLTSNIAKAYSCLNNIFCLWLKICEIAILQFVKDAADLYEFFYLLFKACLLDVTLNLHTVNWILNLGIKRKIKFFMNSSAIYQCFKNICLNPFLMGYVHTRAIL